MDHSATDEVKCLCCLQCLQSKTAFVDHSSTVRLISALLGTRTAVHIDGIFGPKRLKWSHLCVKAWYHDQIIQHPVLIEIDRFADFIVQSTTVI